MTSPTPDSSPAPLRVALCPIHFHPATQFTLPDGVPFVPLNEPIFNIEKWNPSGDRILGLLDPQTEEADVALHALRDAVRSVYLRNFTDCIAEILKVCINWSVQLVVFPEFSIPGDCLLPLASKARGMTVVFGSHTVTSSLLKDVAIYQLPGWSAVEEGDTVAPVLMPDGEWRVGARYSPRKVGFRAGQEQPIELPTGHRISVVSGRWEGEQGRALDPERFGLLMAEAHIRMEEQGGLGYRLECCKLAQRPACTKIAPIGKESGKYPSDVSYTAPGQERIVVSDLGSSLQGGPHRVVETTLVPHIVLNGIDAPWMQTLRQSDELSYFRQTLDAHRADIKQWQSTLQAEAGSLATRHPLRSHFVLWRTRLRQIFDSHQAHSVADMNQALSACHVLPATCPTSLDLELGLLRAVEKQVTALAADLRDTNDDDVLEKKVYRLMGRAPDRLADAVRDQVLALASSRQAISTTPRPQTDSPIHLTHLSLENIRSFASLELPLHVHDPEEGQWILLLGDNGTGKSTILRALVLALADRGVAESLVSDAQTPFRREGEASGRLRVTLNGEPASRDASILPFENREELKREEHPGDARDFNLFAYGCQRGSALGGHAREVSFTPRSDVATLFDEAASLTHAETWLTRLYALALRSNGASLRFFEAVRQSLCGLLPGVESLEFDDQGVWWINGPKVGRARLAALSDGYLTTLGWIIDLIARWSERMQRDGIALDGDFTQHMTGIVVIDEIDLHLHPLWQVSIVTELRRLFPRMSFIATTHNPLTLLGARPGEVHVLRRSQDNANIIVHQVDVPEGTRADQVLTGEWFGLPSTLDDNTLELMEEHRALLREGRPTTDPRRLELEALLRERLGTFEDTALDRIAQSVAAQVIRENYRELSIEERKGIRAKILEAVRAQEAKGKK